MKKLLSLLSVLTISGTAIPTTIAASPYQKEETIISDINYQQTNNLKRKKRQDNKQNVFGILQVVITTSSSVNYSGLALNNKVYFGSNNNKVYEYDPTTGEQKVVITANWAIISSGLALNNKVYFGSEDFKVYEYDPTTGEQKVVIKKDKPIISSGVVLNNKIYFNSADKNVYEYDLTTGEQKVVITGTNKNHISSSGLVLNNKIYFGSIDKNVYEYDPTTGEQKVVINTNGEVDSSGLALNNKVYFGSNDNKVYEYNLTTGKQKVVITTSGSVDSSGVALNNKVYFGSDDGNVYEYNLTTGEQKVVITNKSIISSGVVLNNKIYFGSTDKNVYEYDPLDLIESDIVNMKEQVKRALYLYHKKQNPNSEVKLISNVNLNNLNISQNLALEPIQENKSFNLEKNINICQYINAIFENNTSIQQTQKTASCSKQLKEIKTFQKINGFYKSETASNDKDWSSNVNTSVKATAGGSAGIPLVAQGKVEVEIEAGGEYNFGGSKNYSIEDNSNSSNTEIKTTENTITIDLPSQSIVVPPKSTISINIISWQNEIELILSYYQKVDGIVSADFIEDNDSIIRVSISIKDAMISLQENNILPSKIKINNDNSINFSYSIKSLKQIITSKTKINEIDNSNLNKQNVIFKDNIRI